MTAEARLEAPLLVEHREELLYLLAEAAEIEHGLMACYLYAAFSLKTRDDEGLAPEQLAAVRRWREVVLQVAREEMLHLALVTNVTTAIGGAPHFWRPNFPVSPGFHPSGVTVALAPFDAATLDHFIYLERPEGVGLDDGAGFGAARTYERRALSGKLTPVAQDYATVGHLYRELRAALVRLHRELGDERLFVGDRRVQMGVEQFGFPGMRVVHGLDDALTAIDTIVEQGEGSPSDVANGHFRRFVGIRDEYRALLERDPGFCPGRPVARNPVMRKPPSPEGLTWVDAEPAATLLDLGNATYAAMLRALELAWSRPELAVSERGSLCDVAVGCMLGLTPLGEALTRLPASRTAAVSTAGLTFTMSRSMASPPSARAGLWLLSEALDRVTERWSSAASPHDERLAAAGTAFVELSSSLRRVAGR